MTLKVCVCLAGLCASILLHGDAHLVAHSTHKSTMADSAPATILWAWEEPEDLRAINPQRVGVAFLAERVFLSSSYAVSLRRQRILVPQGVYAIAVARLETMSDFKDSKALRKEAASAVLHLALLPNIRGLQVDFDATASQREFYADVLRQVRAGLPGGVGLTMTALVSWCSDPSGWLATLPVDAAVPMYFRLGKHIGQWDVREPLCKSSQGLSIDEPGVISAARAENRVYLFSPRPWTADQLSVLDHEEFPFQSRGGA